MKTRRHPSMIQTRIERPGCRALFSRSEEPLPNQDLGYLEEESFSYLANGEHAVYLLRGWLETIQDDAGCVRRYIKKCLLVVHNNMYLEEEMRVYQTSPCGVSIFSFYNYKPGLFQKM